MVKVHEKLRQARCRICDHPDLYPFLDLGTMPIPNGYVEPRNVRKREKKYPLGVCVCQHCWLVQLTHVVPAELMFKNYRYIPSTSATMLTHFELMAADIVDRYQLSKSDLVVDIGSNDGTLLTYFKQYQVNVLGVDPAENLVTVANLKGINSIEAFFDRKTAKRVRRKYGRARVITATNVVAHVDNLHLFIRAVKRLLKPGGVFVVEFPYLPALLQKNEFDTIYHEHLSYFSLFAFRKLLKMHRLVVVDAQSLPVHGGSIRIYIQRHRSSNPIKIHVKHFGRYEKELALNTLSPYTAFASRVEQIREVLLKKLSELKAQKKMIIGYGASAKGNVLLNYCQINHQMLDYVADSIPYKQGMFTPGTKIPIVPEKKIEFDQPDYILLLAWNFTDEILRKQQAYRERGGKFIITIPQLQIV